MNLLIITAIGVFLSLIHKVSLVKGNDYPYASRFAVMVATVMTLTLTSGGILIVTFVMLSSWLWIVFELSLNLMLGREWDQVPTDNKLSVFLYEKIGNYYYFLLKFILFIAAVLVNLYYN